MVKSLLSASLVAFASLLAAIPAHAISLNWQFTPNPAFSSTGGEFPYVVKGTIDGLEIGSNSGAGITATVTNTPTGQLLGTYIFVSTPSVVAFIVDTNGNVTFADARFTPTGIYNGSDPLSLYLGGYLGFIHPQLGYMGFYNPQLVDSSDYNPDWTNNVGGKTTFSAATPVPFDFSPTPAVVILGGIFAAKKLRKKLVKK